MPYKMAPVYIGDVGVIVTPEEKPKLPKGFDFSKLTFRQMCNLAVACGISVKDIIGIDHCYDHQKMIPIGGRELPAGMNLFEHCVFCRNCFLFFRIKELPKDDYKES